MKQKIKIKDNEYTTETFLDLLRERFGEKTTGKPFDQNDVGQYLHRGCTPYRYGRIHITSRKICGIRIIAIVKPKTKTT